MNPNNHINVRTTAAMRAVAADSAQVKLVTAFDPQTSLHHFPPPACWHGRMMEHPVGPRGTLYTYTRMHVPKSGTSYLIGFADFEGNVRLLGRIRGAGEPQIGDVVTVVAIDPKDFSAGYVFELLERRNV